MYISRIADDKREQLTCDHLIETAKLASDWAESLGVKQITFLTALLHDMGKFSESFVSYLRESEQNRRGSIIHSTQGAKYIYELASQKNDYILIAEMVGLCIAGHHGVLMDGITPDGETPFLDRICKPDTGALHFTEVKSEFARNCHQATKLNEMLEASTYELQNFIKTCKNQKLNPAFMVHMLTKFIFSCLVDADRHNAYCFETQTKPVLTNPPWNKFSNNLGHFLAQKNNDSNQFIDTLRQKISDQCFCSANRRQGIYQLEVPTGGGKTLSSLRFALEHARIHNMERIIYIIPYLSVLEQTADNIRKALGLAKDDVCILEHHSNLIPPDDEEKVQEKKLLTDRWDAPIVITTVVQFLESIFSQRASKLRKLHNMTNAVLIFDEVQSLPVKCVNLFNDAVNFLSIFGKSTVLLCTATQPLLDHTEHGIRLSGKNIVENVEEDFSALNRTRIVPTTENYTYDELADFVLEIQCEKENCLVILNTKKNVSELYRAVKTRVEKLDLAMNLFHLSTLMCPAHRIFKINEMVEKIKHHEPVICISSQLIEAGVDISFNCVVRAYAGLDSIAQAAGRCNRHGEDPKGKDVYIVNLIDEDLSKLPDIQLGADITKRIIDEKYTDLLSKQAMNRYYSEYFYKRSREMNYILGEKGNLYDLLSNNEKGCQSYINRYRKKKKSPEYHQALQTAGENFFVIENDTISVVVPYGEGLKLVTEYGRATLVDKAAILRKMSRYTVSLYRYQIDKLNEIGALSKVDDHLLLLEMDFYDSECGVDLAKDMKFLCY